MALQPGEVTIEREVFDHRSNISDAARRFAVGARHEFLAQSWKQSRSPVHLRSQQEALAGIECPLRRHLRLRFLVSVNFPPNPADFCKPSRGSRRFWVKASASASSTAADCPSGAAPRR